MNEILKTSAHAAHDFVKFAIEHGVGWYLASGASIAALLGSLKL